MASGLGNINTVYQGSLTQSAPGKPSPSDMYSYLLARGANPNEALMLTSAAASESGLNPTATHDSNQGYGLFGHNGERLLAMKSSNGGQGTATWQNQADFALNELRSRPEGAAVRNATTPEQLAMAQMYYERPQGFSPDDPTAGHNFTGRLNTIRRFTGLNPDATGAFAPSANPQVSPSASTATGAPASLPPGNGAGSTGTAGGNAGQSAGGAILSGLMGKGGAGTALNVGQPGQSAGAAFAAGLGGGLQRAMQPVAPGASPATTPILQQLMDKITSPLNSAVGSVLNGGFPPGPATPGAAGAPSGVVAPMAGGGAPSGSVQAGAPAGGFALPAGADAPMPVARPADLAAAAPQAATPAAPTQMAGLDPAVAAANGAGTGGFLDQLGALFGGSGGAGGGFAGFGGSGT